MPASKDRRKRKLAVAGHDRCGKGNLAQNHTASYTVAVLRASMLRITTSCQNKKVTLKLEGRLVDAWAYEFESVAVRLHRQSALVVDINDLTYTDAKGEEALLLLHRLGGQFYGNTPFCRGLCGRLGIPLRDTLPVEAADGRTG